MLFLIYYVSFVGAISESRRNTLIVGNPNQEINGMKRIRQINGMNAV